MPIVDPAVISTLPPLPFDPVPTLRRMSPDVPPLVAFPVSTWTNPESPFVDFPLAIKMFPLTPPSRPASEVITPIDPLEVVLLCPELTTTAPPVPTDA